MLDAVHPQRAPTNHDEACTRREEGRGEDEIVGGSIGLDAAAHRRSLAICASPDNPQSERARAVVPCVARDLGRSERLGRRRNRGHG